MEPYQRVRVRGLQERPDSARYDGWGVNRRPPAIGDVGSVIEILSAPGLPSRYTVECCGPDGVDIWLGDFLEDQLEPVETSRQEARAEVLAVLRKVRALAGTFPGKGERELLAGVRRAGWRQGTKAS